MPEPTLNAVVALRTEISPWLIILRVVPDGWQLARLQSRPVCRHRPARLGAPLRHVGAGRPAIRPQQADPAGLLHRFFVPDARIHGVLRRPGHLRRADPPALCPQHRRPALARAEDHRHVHLRPGARGPERGDDRHRHGPGALHEHADDAPDLRRPAGASPSCTAHGTPGTWATAPNCSRCSTCARTSATARSSAGRRASRCRGRARRATCRTCGRTG